MPPSLRFAAILFFFAVSSIAAFAQPVAPVAVDTAWDMIPRAIGINPGDARFDRNGDVVCTILIRDSARFGPLKITTNKASFREEIGIAKFGADGTPLWIRNTGDARWSQITGFDIDRDGNAYAVYYANPNPYFDSLKIGNLRLETDGGSFLVKYSPTGDLLWVRELGDSLINATLADDGNRGVIVSGGLTGRMIYGSDTLALPGSKRDSYRYGAALISVTPDGSYRWARMFTRTNGVQGGTVAVAPNGDILLTGWQLQFTIADTFKIGASRITNPGLFIARLTANGNPIWARGITSGPLENYVTDIAFDSTGNIILAGGVDDNIGSHNFGKIFWDTLGLAGKPIVAYGSDDIFLAKLGGDGRFLWSEVFGARRGDRNARAHALADGAIIMTGAAAGGHMNFDGHDYYKQGSGVAFIARYEADGTPAWLKVFDHRGEDGAADVGGTIWASASAIDAQGRILLIGGFNKKSTFDSFTLGANVPADIPYGQDNNMFVIRLAPGTYTRPEAIWTKIDDGLPYNMHSFGTPDVRTLALFGGELYAGLAPGDARATVQNTGSGAYSSTDNGSTWHANTGGTPPTDSMRYGVEYFAALGDSLYHVTGLLTNSSDYFSKGMVMDRLAPHRWNWLKRSGDPDLHAVFTVDGDLYGAAKYYQGSYGLLRWDRAAAEWHRLDSSIITEMSVRWLTGYGNVLLASTFNYDGLFRSTDRGRTWTRASEGLPKIGDKPLTAAGTLAVIGDTLYLATPDGFNLRSAMGVYRSIDAGEHWTMVSDGLPFQKYGLADSIPVAIDVLYAKGSVLFAGCERGIWMLLPGAARWRPITDDLQQCHVNAIIADDTYLYASMQYCGMWRRPLSSLSLGVDKDGPAIETGARRFNLSAAPNPSSRSTRIRFMLPTSGKASISLHDMSGRLVRVIASGVMALGEHEMALDLEGLPSAEYLVRLETGDGGEAIVVGVAK